MAHEIEEFDLGFISGTQATWHNHPSYHVLGNRPVSQDEVDKVTGFEVEKVPTFVDFNGEHKSSGAYAIVRKDHNIVLAPSVGERYVATPHRSIWNHMNEFLLAEFPLKVAGTGTLNNGASWFIQLVAEQFFIRGDESPNEMRLSYFQQYGVTAHSMYVTTVRQVCKNTVRLGMAEGVAKKMMERQKHTKNAETKINASMEVFAELHLHLQKHKEQMEFLASKQVDRTYIKEFMDAFLPTPAEDGSTKAKNQNLKDREKIKEIFGTGQHLERGVDTSRYALLNAFTDYIDHHSYSRSDVDRQFDAEFGKRSVEKDNAISYLLAA